MIKTLIKLGLVVFVGILGYNYFLGTPTEKEDAKETVETITNATKDAFSAITKLFKSEKEKYNAGKYDDAMDKVSVLFQNLKDKAQDLASNSDEYLDKLSQLNEQKEELQDKINGFKGKEMTEEESTEANEQLKNDLNDLMKKIDGAIKEVGISTTEGNK